MTKYIKDKSYPTIYVVNSSKTVDIVYVDINREQPSKTSKLAESLFRRERKYGPRK